MPLSTDHHQNMPISLKHLILRFKWRISFTFLLVIVESLLAVFYPLLIGLAINDLLEGSYQGSILLGSLGVASLIIGTLRRFYDTRVYSKIYCQIAPEVADAEFNKGSPVSKVSARSGLLTEFVEFLENSMPEIIGVIISMVGGVIIIASLNFQVFLACLALLVLILIVYGVTGKLNFNLNSEYNNQLEQQVSVLESRQSSSIQQHFNLLMKWNIKLSDLETWNYFVIWLGVIALLVFSPIAAIDSGIVKYGLIFSILVYVFEFIESTISLPLFIQQLIRLKEISHRLNEPSK